MIRLGRSLGAAWRANRVRTLVTALRRAAPSPRAALCVLAASANLSVAACAVPQTTQPEQSQIGVSRHAEVNGPKFIPHDERESGPAALAMVLCQSGIDVTMADVAKEVRASGREGAFKEKVIGVASRYRRLAYPVRGIDAVLREIEAGRPVIVSLNLGYPWKPAAHFAVVIGYDLDVKTLTLLSGRTPRKVMPIEVFKKIWEQGKYWAFVVLRPGALPADEPQPRPYLDAVKGLEYAGHYGGARKAYETAVRLWPQSLEARMGLGNALIALGRHQEAARAFAEAAMRHPGAAMAHDSLARALIDLGQLRRARWAAQTAVALDGANAEAYRQTLQLINVLAAHSRQPKMFAAKRGT